MTIIHSQKFLLDENIDHRLKRVFVEKSIECYTIYDLNLKGIQNGELSKHIKENNLVLVTHDSDFVDMWKTYSIKVIWISIHPATIKSIEPYIRDLLNSYNRKIHKNFLLVLTREGIHYHH